MTVNVGTNATISTSDRIDRTLRHPGVQPGRRQCHGLDVGGRRGHVRQRGRHCRQLRPRRSSADSTITVTADGTINSGTNTQADGYPAGGILTGYYPNNRPVPDANVQETSASPAMQRLMRPAAAASEAFNFGTGNATVTTEAGSSITAIGSPIRTTADGAFTPDRHRRLRVRRRRRQHHQCRHRHRGQRRRASYAQATAEERETAPSRSPIMATCSAKGQRNPVVQISTAPAPRPSTTPEQLRRFRCQPRVWPFQRTAARSRSTIAARSSATSRWPTRRSTTRAAAYGTIGGL